jgi:hypothetical protein
MFEDEPPHWLELNGHIVWARTVLLYADEQFQFFVSAIYVAQAVKFWQHIMLVEFNGAVVTAPATIFAQKVKLPMMHSPHLSVLLNLTTGGGGGGANPVELFPPIGGGPVPLFPPYGGGFPVPYCAYKNLNSA